MSFDARGGSVTGSAVRFFKTTLVGGLVFLVPLIILLALATKAAELLHRLARPLAAYLPVESLAGMLIADSVTILFVVLCCFLAGLLARLSFANRFINRAETGVLWRIPGYGLIKGLTDSLDNSAANAAMRPALAHFDDAAQLAFEVDQLADGRKVVYLPSSPDPRSGAVMVMEAHRVERVPMTFVAAIRVLRAMGHGSGPALSGTPSRADTGQPSSH